MLIMPRLLMSYFNSQLPQRGDVQNQHHSLIAKLSCPGDAFALRSGSLIARTTISRCPSIRSTARPTAISFLTDHQHMKLCATLVIHFKDARGEATEALFRDRK